VLQHILRPSEREEPARARPHRRDGAAIPGGAPASRRCAPRLALALGAALPGCTAAPSIVLLGASFPDWLFCITGGVVAMVVVHLALGRRRRLAWLAPPALTYPALTATFAALAWLAFFRR
jgi:hypothetical protein